MLDSERLPPSAESFGSDYYKTVYRHYRRQNPSYKYRFYREFIAKHAPAGSRLILEVGCAFGGFLSSLPDQWNRFGADINSHTIEQARGNCSDLMLATATLETNTFRGPFEVVTSFDVIEHIPDLTMVSKAVTSLLKPGGLFVFVVPLRRSPWAGGRSAGQRPTHVHKNSRRFWLDWARQNFTLVDRAGIYRILLPGVYLHYPTHALRAISPAIIVAAKRQPSAWRNFA